MRQFNESIARWVIQGVASGEPMYADHACKVLNEVLAGDRVGTSHLFLWSTKAIEIVNRLAVDGQIVVVIDPKDGGINRFELRKE